MEVGPEGVGVLAPFGSGVSNTISLDDTPTIAVGNAGRSPRLGAHAASSTMTIPAKKNRLTHPTPSPFCMPQFAIPL